MDRPAHPASPARQAQALDEVAGDLAHWRRVATAAVSAVERAGAEAGPRLHAGDPSMAEAMTAAETTGRSVADAVGDTDRSQWEVEEARTSVAFRAEAVARSSRYVDQSVARWRASGGRPLQFAELGNAVAGKAAGRLDGCRSRCRALADGVQSAGSMREALVAKAAERDALAGAGRAWLRGATHLEALHASSRVDAASVEAGRRTERAITRLRVQEEALRCFDRPAAGGR